MPLVVMLDHFAPLLDELITYLGGCTIHLFQNNHTPAETDDLTDYTECNFSGYSSQTTTGWGPAFLNADDKGEIDADDVIFTVSSGGVNNNVYGYYIKDSLGYLFYAERNPTAPVYMSTIGQTYIVKLKLTLRNDPSP